MSDLHRVLVTGAAGHLGSHLAPLLVARGYDVLGLDLVAPPSPPEGWSFRAVDLLDLDALRAAGEGRDLIVHCASIHPWKPYPDGQYLDANVKGCWNVYATAQALGIGRVVLTSSIAAIGYQHTPTADWPVTEDREFPIADLYSFTKHAQEDVARLFARFRGVRTIALRPPAFMPKPALQTGFLLTANFAVVDDVAAAHVAAVDAAGRDDLEAFEACFVVNRLPYQASDAAEYEAEGLGALVRRYWPAAWPWLSEQGYAQRTLSALYDLGKAERLLGWRPGYNFDQWWAEHGPA